jgi:hypothetical protein
VSDDIRQILETVKSTGGDEKTLAERIWDHGFAVGLARGRASRLLRLLEARGFTLSNELRDQVTSSTDVAQLDLWFDRAATVASAAEVFAD